MWPMACHLWLVFISFLEAKDEVSTESNKQLQSPSGVQVDLQENGMMVL